MVFNKAKFIRFFFLSYLMMSIYTVAQSSDIFMESKLKNSNGVLFGVLNNKTYKKLPSGKLVTEASFKILKVSGIDTFKIINKNNFKVYYPGGKWQGVDYKDSTYPELSKGEELIVLLKKDKYGFMLQDGIDSIFEIKNLSRKKYLVSKFNLSKKILLDKFRLNVALVFKEELHEVMPDFYFKKENKVQRSIASVSDSEHQSSTIEKRSSLWGIISVFIFLIAMSLMISKKRR